MNKLLIIDDDIKLTDLLSEFFANHDFDINIQNDPSDFLATMDQFQPDLIILDITLPGSDGFQILRKIREKHDTPVIMLTARGEISDRVVGLVHVFEGLSTLLYRPGFGFTRELS